MKKPFVVATVLSLTILMIGCGATKSNGSNSSGTADSSANRAQDSIGSSPDVSGGSTISDSKSNMQPAPAASSNAVWSDAYETILQKAQEDCPNDPGVCSYSIYDLDHDGTPELFLKTGTCEADFMFHIYTIANSVSQEVLQIGGGHSSVCGISGQNGFLVHSGQMNYEKIEAYYGKSDSLPQSPEILFEGEVQEYHNLTPLQTYELHDSTGLQWTENPSETNQSVLDTL